MLTDDDMKCQPYLSWVLDDSGSFESRSDLVEGDELPGRL